jgi:hypothetical protein
MKTFRISTPFLLLLGAFALTPPLVAQAPVGATAKCEDGTYSKAQSRAGACSAHGGVATWLGRTNKAKPGTPRTARRPEGATARCEDGSYSEAANEQGACSQHGGVATWFGTDRGPRARDDKASPATRRTTPARATVRCEDGTSSTAATRQGACSGHGGIASKSQSSRETSRAKARPQADDEWMTTNAEEATARCVDGTYSKSQHHTGTCSYHGGVKEWLRDDIPN